MNSLTYHFDLICHLIWRDFSLRYKRSVFGVFWSFILPLSQLMVLTFLFRRVIPLNIDNYPAFVFSGLLPWTWFNTCIGSAGSLFISNRNFMRHPNFIPATLILVNTFSNLLNYLIALPILFVMLIFSGKALTLALLSLPLLFLIQGALIVGLSLIISTMNVFYRDIQHILNVLLMLLFYITPVFYQFRDIGKKYQFVYTFSPIATLIEGYRSIFFYGTFPDWNSLLFAGMVSFVVCGFGCFVYHRSLHEVIDTI